MKPASYFSRVAGKWLSLTVLTTTVALGVIAAPALFANASQASPATFDVPATKRSFADVVEMVSPAVVAISVTQHQEAVPMSAYPGQLPGDMDSPFGDFFGRFFGAPGMNPPSGRPVQALGSGFLVDASGYIVTNNHVVDSADTIKVLLEDGREFDASLIGTDPKTDLALLKIDSTAALPAVDFGDSDVARVGDWVLAIGNPFGLGGSATAGIISARGRDIRSGPYDDYLQIDAPINSGNSGGPVFNADGQVIGVNTAIYSPNGGNVGIGFAIPSRQVRTIVDELRTSGVVHRGWLGVQIQDLDEDLAKSLGLKSADGALIADVVDDSPAAKSGLQIGDVITDFGDNQVRSAKSLGIAVADADPTKTVPVRIIRNGKTKTVQVRLGEAETSVAKAGTDSSKDAAVPGSLGLSLTELTAAQRLQLGLPENYSGVLVSRVAPGSPAAQQGLRPGDVISRVGSKNVSTVADATAAIASAKSSGSGHAALLVRRRDGQQFVSVAFS